MLDSLPKHADASLRSEEQQQRFLTVAAVIASLPLLPPRWLPMVDLPQHELVADALARHLSGVSSGATDANLFTYNAGFEFAALLLRPLIGPVGGGHVVLAAGAAGLTLAIARMRRLLGASPWPALLAPLLTLHYAASWGFANFTLGVPLLFVVVGDALELHDGRRGRAFLARATSCALALALTHVLATLAACVALALIAIPSLFLARSASSLRRWATAAIPLLMASAFDVSAFLWARAHPHTPWENSWAEGRHDGPVARITSVVSNTLGASSDRADVIILAALTAALVALVVRAPREARRRDTTAVVSAFLPIGFATLYLVIPTVFIATFYVGERFAALAFLAAIATVPCPPPSRTLRGLFVAASIGATIRLELVVRAADASARDGIAVLDAIDPNASLVPVNRDLRVEGFARSPLRHLFARHALRAGAVVGYSFLRFESPPVRARLPSPRPELPPGFEGDARAFDATEAWARGWDAFFVVDAPARTPATDEEHRRALFGGVYQDIRLIARRGRFSAYRWASRRTVDTR